MGPGTALQMIGVLGAHLFSQAAFLTISSSTKVGGGRKQGRRESSISTHSDDHTALQTMQAGDATTWSTWGWQDFWGRLASWGRTWGLDLSGLPPF